MTIEQLEKAKSIEKEIEFCRQNIRNAMYTQNENVAPRVTHLQCNGVGAIHVLESIFRLVGKLCLTEYQQKLMQLEAELAAL